MSRRLRSTVYVAGRAYPAGDVPPADVAARITNPAAWDGPAEEPDAGSELSAQVRAGIEYMINRYGSPNAAPVDEAAVELEHAPGQPGESGTVVPDETSEVPGIVESLRVAAEGARQENEDLADAASAVTEQAPKAPPRKGRGSGIGAWRAYAEQLGLDVPEHATRDDIVALVDARN